jgi:hypothetical protein
MNNKRTEFSKRPTAKVGNNSNTYPRVRIMRPIFTQFGYMLMKTRSMGLFPITYQISSPKERNLLR